MLAIITIMRVLIMADMEGVSGIICWNQVTGGDPMYEEARRLYTEEVNAAVRGARRAGATEIVAVDCHGAGGAWTFNSFVPDMMECDWVSGHPWGRYTDFIEQGCDACLCVGMHARANTSDGGMCHTISTTTWRNLWFNEDLVGETGVNAAVCGVYGVPVVLVTGDQAVCREADELLGRGLTTVQVKQSLSTFSARNIPPAQARQKIEEGAFESLTNLSMNAVKPYQPSKPCTITIELSSVQSGLKFKGRHGVELPDPLKVVSKGKDWQTAWDQFWSFDR